MGIQIQMQFDKDFGPIVNFLHEFVPKLNIEEGNKKISNVNSVTWTVNKKKYTSFRLGQPVSDKRNMR